MHKRGIIKPGIIAILLFMVILIGVIFLFDQKPGILGKIINIQGAVTVDQFGKKELPSETVSKVKINYEQLQTDPDINTIIESYKIVDDDLVVKFFHISNKEEPIEVIGNVNYELSKTTAKPGEIIILTVFDWNNEYFELKVGSESEIFAFEEKTQTIVAQKTKSGETIREDMANWNSNTIELSDGKFQTDFRIKWVNYLDENDAWKPINPDFVKLPGGWMVRDAPFIAIAPLKSDGTAFFVSNNRYDIFDKKNIDAPIITKTIKALDVKSVVGKKEKGNLGYGETTYIIYKNAYPSLNADLIYWVHQGRGTRLDKLVRFNTAPSEDVRISFEIKYVTDKKTEIKELKEVLDKGELKKLEKQWDKQSKLKTKSAFSIKEEGETQRRGVGIKAVKIWDSNYDAPNPGDWKVQNIDTELEVKPGKETYLLTKIVPASFFTDAVLPVYTDTESTFNPDAGTGVTAVDGSVGVFGQNSIWSTLIGHAGGWSNDDGTTLYVIQTTGSTTSNQFKQLYRGIMLFDTDSIPDSDSIDSAILSVYGTDKNNVGGCDPGPDSNIYSSAPASNGALENGDFNSLGSTEYATTISYASWSGSSYNDYTFNNDGLAAISKTGISKFGIQNANYDAADQSPCWVNNNQVFQLTGSSADVAETTSDPKLVVTHSSDTCTYSSGDWNIAAADNCVVSSNTDLGGNDLILIGTGTLDITAQISNVGNVIVHGSGARLVCRNANGCFG